MDNEMIKAAYRHTRIDLSEDQMKEILPENMLRAWNGKKVISFGGIDEEENLQALAVFSASELHGQEMVLEYIVVSEDRRQEGRAHDLLEYCEDSLKKCGIRSIYVRVSGETEEIAGWFDFFVREKYVPVLFCGRLMSYDIRDIRQCEVMRHGKDLIGAFGRKIKKFEEHLEISVRRFMQQKTGVYIKENVYDRTYSRIFWDEERIAGVVFLKQTDDRTVMMTGCYIEPDNNAKYILAALLYAALQEVCASVDDDVEFGVQLYRLEHYGWIKKLLGEAKQDLLMQEYIRKL